MSFSGAVDVPPALVADANYRCGAGGRAAENAVSRCKALVGTKLTKRVFENQRVDASNAARNESHERARVAHARADCAELIRPQNGDGGISGAEFEFGNNAVMNYAFAANAPPGPINDASNASVPSVS